MMKEFIREEELIEAAQRLIRIPSVKYDGRETGYERRKGAPFGEGIAKALDCALDICKELGFRTKNCNGYAGFAEAGEGEELLGILVHLDVVPEGNDWSYPPYGAEIHDGSLYGRGVIDDKGPAAAAMFALKAAVDSGIVLKKRVRLIFGLDEENDWEDMEYYLKNEELPTAGFTPDADFPVIYGEMGILTFDLVARCEEADDDSSIAGGDASNVVPDFCSASIKLKDGSFYAVQEKGRAAHAAVPEKGDNAISKVMEALYSKKAEGNFDCSEAICRMIDFYHDRIGFYLHGEAMGCDLSDEKTGRLTFNSGVIRAAAREAVLSVDMRCPVSFVKDMILEKITEAVEPYGLILDHVRFEKPIYADKDSPVIKSLLKAYRSVTGDESEPSTMGGASYARAMDNVFAFGPVFPGRESTEHRKDEHLSVEDLILITQIYAEAIKELAT